MVAISVLGRHKSTRSPNKLRWLELRPANDELAYSKKIIELSIGGISLLNCYPSSSAQRNDLGGHLPYNKIASLPRRKTE
jgi:hypothetical protein